MKINGRPTRTIRVLPENGHVEVIDQTRLPFRF